MAHGWPQYAPASQLYIDLGQNWASQILDSYYELLKCAYTLRTGQWTLLINCYSHPRMVIILDCVQNHAKDLDALWLFGDYWVLTQTHMYVCMYACMYNPDCLHRICTFSTLRVSTEKKKLRIFGGRNSWGRILECTTRAKANTLGTTIFPYRKQVWNPAVWSFFKFYQLQKLEKARKMETRENISGHPQNNNTSITFGSGLWKEMGFLNRPFFDYFHIKEGN